MTPELNWCGWPIGPGESYYGGKPAAKKHQHFAVITEGDLAEVFGNGLRKLTRVEAAKLWNYSPADTGQAAIAL